MLKSLLDGIGASIGAASFAVLPSFIQQYTASLSTCESELARVAGNSSLTPDALASIEERAGWCGKAAQALDRSAGVDRVAAFFNNFDTDVARSTLHVFQPAVQMSVDGLYFFIAGLIVGLIVINLIAFPFRVIARRRRERAHYR
ncbi:MAG: DUF2937 family protein [Alphaproteobacteria bacterium]|nr:DUF2937 family protein [Alphaproteobacteria bacterium]